jgi:hypothetical protein
MNLEIADAVAVLQRTPDTVRAMLSGLPDMWTARNEGGESWSPFIIVGHLAHAEETDWLVRAKLILEQGPNRRFAPFDRFGQFEKSRGKTLSMLLDEFARLRADNLTLLRTWQLTPAQLVLSGEHPEFGSVTLSQLLATWVVHDLGHIAQIARVMAKQYATAVGPWRVYLPVLDR